MATQAHEEKLTTDKVLPTLYIALGGTGMEMALRLRRRILNAFWGSDSKPVRIGSLSEFPVAQFLHIDLDQGANRESDKTARTDMLAEAVAFSDEERIVESFDMGRYIRSADNLSMYPHIQNWFPLSPDEVNELKIDPSKGAGQIRAISRLYFFDKAKTIKARIRQKLEYLKNSTSNKNALDRLGLDVYPRLRIVVLASSAGGTGAGAFLDAGYLAQYIGKQIGLPLKVDLIMMLASGYAKYGSRVEANTYAAMMELETCITERIPYATGWEAGERPELAQKPYDDVYFVDTANVNAESTANHADVHDMVASALFEDYSLAAFADRKRQVEVNQQQFKLAPYQAPMPSNRFGDTKQAYAKSYSTFGQAVVDTQVQAHQNIRIYAQANAMLQAFFGVSDGQPLVTNQPTEQERDGFMQESLHTKRFSFTEFPDLAAKIQYKHVQGDFWDYHVTDELLRDVNQVGIVASLEDRVNNAFEQIRTEVGRSDWQAKAQEAVKQLERDVKKTVEASSMTSESRIEDRRKQLLSQMQNDDGLSKRLFIRLDDKERGGLDYTISLVELIKDRIDNETTGYAKELEANAKRFLELSESLGVAELDKLYANFRQTLGLFGSKSQGDTVLEQIKEATFGYLAYYCRAVASTQAALLLREISIWLGKKQGLDANADPIWTGFVGQLISGRQSVKALMTEIQEEEQSITQSTTEAHATYLVLPTEQAKQTIVTGIKARDWAQEAFKDFGGSKQLFAMLKNKDSKATLLSALRNKALEQIYAADDQQETQSNPLIESLRLMSPPERRKLFEMALSRAMPWVNANLDGDWKVDPNQYTCLVGVQNKVLFEELFGAELRMAIPANAKLTANRLWIDESGIPGRMVIYSEISGLPIPALNLLKDTWGHSYRQVSKEIPCHTHRNRGWFKHPIQRTATEMNRLADDFKLYLQAVACNVLKYKRRDDGSAVYQVEIKRGDNRSIGGERTVRLEGLEEGVELNAIKSQVLMRIDQMQTPAQWLAFAAIAGYYAADVYPPREAVSDLGKDIYIKGFAHAIADSLREECESKARQLGYSNEQIDGVIFKLSDRMSAWTNYLEGSVSDVYESEVYKVHADKRSLKPEVFTTGWIDQLLAGAAGGAIAAGPASAAPLSPPAMGMAPPPLTSAAAYHLSINGQSYGPYSLPQLQQFIPSGQFLPTSLVWAQGMPAWQAASLVHELANLFAPAQPPALPGAVMGGGHMPPAPPPPPTI